MRDDVPGFGQIFLCLAEPEGDAIEVDFLQRRFADGLHFGLGSLETKGQVRHDALWVQF
jgi:hypothetical protein